MDNALARGIESDTSRKLDIRQWVQLVSRCRAAREYFGERRSGLRDHSGAWFLGKLIGGSLQVHLEKSRVEELMVNGFLPDVDVNRPGITEPELDLYSRAFRTRRIRR